MPLLEQSGPSGTREALYHGDQVTRLMDKYLPNWRAHRDLLNQSPLGHQEWKLRNEHDGEHGEPATDPQGDQPAS